MKNVSNQGKPSLSPSLYTVAFPTSGKLARPASDRYLLGTGLELRRIAQMLREREKRTLIASGSIPENVAYTIHWQRL